MLCFYLTSLRTGLTLFFNDFELSEKHPKSKKTRTSGGLILSGKVFPSYEGRVKRAKRGGIENECHGKGVPGNG
jgi:hypothetical protein